MVRELPEPQQRSAVVVEARSWLRTPYHHAADIKRAGVDCGMLLYRVFTDLGLIDVPDPRPYPRDWMLHRSEERYLGFILDNAAEVAQPLPGDVVAWQVGRCFAHAGIVTMWPRVVHAYSKAGFVQEDDVSLTGPINAWHDDKPRPRRFFSYWRRPAP